VAAGWAGDLHGRFSKVLNAGILKQAIPARRANSSDFKSIPAPANASPARATASAFGPPLLRLDMGRVFGRIVGGSLS